MRISADQAFSRTVGAPLIPGNEVRLLKDARENYPAWLSAIESAEHSIHFESYIIHEDVQGRRFAEALIAKARAGVKVRLIYDWMGGLFPTSNKFWRALQAQGVEVRCFNRPQLDSPLGWLGRDHRKMLAVDGRVGFVAGLCVGQMWVGDAEKGVEGWRDTGVEVRGPAVADIEQAFAMMWAEMGPPLPEDELVSTAKPAGDVHLRVVASLPNTAALYRLDQIIAATARESLWLTDAYFAGTSPYVQALRSAALDGVDVRLLVPQANDIPVMRALSRSGYRPLLEAGIRVYEWNGPMLHAKTAVADGRWARVGSSNLNLASWVGNWELDLVIEDQEFGEEMERMYLQDLENATEIVLTAKHRVFKPRRPRARRLREKFGLSGSGRTAAGAVRLGNAVGAAISDRRILSPAEARIMFSAGVLLLAFAVVAVLWPRWISVPLSVFAVWMAASLFIRAFKLHREGKQEQLAMEQARREHQPAAKRNLE
ncbi:MAG TPA: phospholipase D-like domain-containing protein [Blastocatellia bacterium]|nr:phospholipase D-like domain-containing protein [Blastocatellia bacterium]HMV83145.1 phospholipase D-like domain-containing protein [Blastocatellia bacterium]HMX24440.1 phospholipase D-like domain-containing protein [Blastocatellia bacterium]HMY75155.1 phospholipase D-like domain-containing protein [Blastocatellia bacterium]HNG32511.1 phospholipase D-like domain-containing protein [Blastocatellia bacterium]